MTSSSISTYDIRTVAISQCTEEEEEEQQEEEEEEEEEQQQHHDRKHSCVCFAAAKKVQPTLSYNSAKMQKQKKMILSPPNGKSD